MRVLEANDTNPWVETLVSTKEIPSNGEIAGIYYEGLARVQWQNNQDQWSGEWNLLDKLQGLILVEQIIQTRKVDWLGMSHPAGHPDRAPIFHCWVEYERHIFYIPREQKLPAHIIQL